MRFLVLLLALTSSGCALDIFVQLGAVGDGAGQVTGSSGDFAIDCAIDAGVRNGTCRSEFTDQGGGGDVSMVAVPAPGSLFVQWTGCAETDGTECVLRFSGQVDNEDDTDIGRPNERHRSAVVCFTLESTGADPSACVAQATFSFFDSEMSAWTQDGVSTLGGASVSGAPRPPGAGETGRTASSPTRSRWSSTASSLSRTRSPSR